MAQSILGGRLFGAGNTSETRQDQRIEPTFGEPLSRALKAAPVQEPSFATPSQQAVDVQPAFVAVDAATAVPVAPEAKQVHQSPLAPAPQPFEYKLAHEPKAAEPRAEVDDINAANEKFLALAAKYRVDQAPAQTTDHLASASLQAQQPTPKPEAQNAYDGVRQLQPVSAVEAAAVQDQIVAPKRSEIPGALGFSTNAEPKPLDLGNYVSQPNPQHAAQAQPAPQPAPSFDQLAAAPMAATRPSVDLGAQSIRPQPAIGPSGTTPGVRVENLRVDRDMTRTMPRRRRMRPLVFILGLLAVLGLGGAGAYAMLFADLGGQQVVRIQHDLTDEKIIPEIGQRGGYEVPHQDFQVLQRNSDLVSQFTSSRAAPAPERPSFTSIAAGSNGGQNTAMDTSALDAARALLQPMDTGVPAPVLAFNDPAMPNVPGVRPIAPTAQSNAIDALAGPQIDLNAPQTSADVTTTLAPIGNEALFQQVQLVLDGGVSGPQSNGASVFVPSPENPEFSSDNVPDTPIPSLVPATQVTSPWGLQIAALRTSDGARRLWQNMQQANFNLLADVGFKIETIQSNSGLLYRLQIGPFPTRTTAMDVCAELQKTEGTIGCFAVTSGS